MPELTSEELRALYASMTTIATVGASSDESKPASVVPRYMQLMGFRVIPVHPTAAELYGEAAYPTLDAIPEPFDTVDIFRPAAEAVGVARTAIELGAKIVWLQDGESNDELAALAAAAGVTVIDRGCIATTFRDLGLGPDPATAVQAAYPSE